jgi:hypothetical protein
MEMSSSQCSKEDKPTELEESFQQRSVSLFLALAPTGINPSL